MSTCLESRAWTADGAFACHAGRLELRSGSIRFVTDEGRQLFGGPARLQFPWWLVDGVIVSADGADHTVLFCDPYLGAAVGDARETRRRWKEALAEAAPPRPAHRVVARRRPAPRRPHAVRRSF